MKSKITVQAFNEPDQYSLFPDLISHGISVIRKQLSLSDDSFSESSDNESMPSGIERHKECKILTKKLATSVVNFSQYNPCHIYAN